MEKCQRCESERLVLIYSFDEDANIGCKIISNNYHYAFADGCKPFDFGLSNKNDDELNFVLCLNCGQIQGSFPKLKLKSETGISDDNLINFYNKYLSKNQLFKYNQSYEDRCNLVQDIIKPARELLYSFGDFIEMIYVNSNDICFKKEMPSADVFIDMYRNNITFIEE